MQRWYRPTSARFRTVAMYGAGYLAFVAINTTHAFIRSAGDDSTARRYSAGGFEDAIFSGWQPNVWIQQVTPFADALTQVAFVVWASLFYMPLLLCAVALFARGHRGLMGLLAFNAVLILSADVMFALAPTRPPWMDLPIQRPIMEYSGIVRSDGNPFASVPSLHVAVPVAYALWFGAQPDRRLRPFGWVLGVWAAAMWWAVVYTGEHYVLGASAGVAWSFAVFTVLRRIGIIERAATTTQRAPKQHAIPQTLATEDANALAA